MQVQNSHKLFRQAAKEGNIEAVRRLLSEDVINSQGRKCGSTALHIAAFRGHHRIVKLLIENGADTEMRNTELGATALHIACRSHLSNLETVKILVVNGANIMAVTTIYRLGSTPLHFAGSTYSGDQTKIIKFLIDKGAKRDFLNRRYESPVDRAIAEGYPEIAILIRNYQPGSIGRNPYIMWGTVGIVGVSAVTALALANKELIEENINSICRMQ